MKHILSLLILFLPVLGYAQKSLTMDSAETAKHLLLPKSIMGSYCVLIGKDAGYMLTNESYCIIIGHDSIARNLKGNDMLWYVDYTEPHLIHSVVLELKRYEAFVGTKYDTKENRATLAMTIAELYKSFYNW